MPVHRPTAPAASSSPSSHTAVTPLPGLRPGAASVRRAARAARVAALGTVVAALLTAGATGPVGAQANAGATQAAPGALSSTCPAPEARAFDFWPGEWDVVNRYRTPAGLQPIGTARVQVYPVVDRCAVVEHWDGHLGSTHLRGFSLRAWDPAREEWLLVLNWPSDGPAGFSTLRGRFRHGRGEFFTQGTGPDGEPRTTRFTFADVSDEAFRWDQAFSTDDGESWSTRWVMEYRRRPPSAAPVLNVPTRTPGLCPGGPPRALDGLVGRWTAESDGRTVVRDVYPVLDGCALVEFLEDGPWRAYRITGWDANEQTWIQWSIDSSQPTLHRFTGALEEGRLVLAEAPEGEGAATGPRRRLEWSLDGTPRSVWSVGGVEGWTRVRELVWSPAGGR